MRRRPLLATAVLLTPLALLLAGCGGDNLIELATDFWSLGCCGTVVVILDILALVELAGSRRSTGNKVLWALLIIFAPLLGYILYYLFGRD